MHIFLYPEQTTFINSQTDLKNKNFGLDEILEVEKIVTDQYNGRPFDSGSNLTSASYISRTLLKFDFSQISESISNGDIPFPNFKLKLYSSDARGIQAKYDVKCFPLSSSWINGKGKKFDEYPSEFGVTWISRGYSNSNWTTPGGDYYQNISSSYRINKTNQDINMDITNIVSQFISSSIEDNGVILKLSDESSSIDYGKIRYFSLNTNTIYSPYIDVSWDDSTYSLISGSAIPSTIEDRVVYIKNLHSEYNESELVKLGVSVRPKYIEKTFQRWPTRTYPSNDYESIYVLPSSSYYSVVDDNTMETRIDFDDGTKISSNDSGSFFTIDMSCLPKERYYKILIKVIETDRINIYDTGVPFKITRS